MHTHRLQRTWRTASSLVLLAVLFLAACDREPPHRPSPDPSGEVRTFTGTWTASGSRQTLQLEAGREAVIFRLTGSLLLSGKQRIKRGFQADVLGLADTRNGVIARSVWTDERGDRVFSDLRGDGVGAGQLIEAEFTGGTGRYTGVTGAYAFRWKRVISNKNGEVSGRVGDFEGWARLATPDPGSTPTELP